MAENTVSDGGLAYRKKVRPRGASLRPSGAQARVEASAFETVETETMEGTLK